MNKPKLTYNVKEAAEATGVSERSIWRAIHSGELAASYPTSRAVVSEQELHRWATTDRRSA